MSTLEQIKHGKTRQTELRGQNLGKRSVKQRFTVIKNGKKLKCLVLLGWDISSDDSLGFQSRLRTSHNNFSFAQNLEINTYCAGKLLNIKFCLLKNRTIDAVFNNYNGKLKSIH